MYKGVGIADFIFDPRESFRRYEDKRLSGINAASLCFVLARIHGQPYLEKLQDLGDEPLGVELHGQTCHTIVSINGISIPWPFTRETALRAATPLNLDSDVACEQMLNLAARYQSVAGQGDHKFLAEYFFIQAYRSMLTDDASGWKRLRDLCGEEMRACNFGTIEECVPLHGPMHCGIPIPNWFTPEVVLPRLGISAP
jgi:hypothetical protein